MFVSIASGRDSRNPRLHEDDTVYSCADQESGVKSETQPHRSAGVLLFQNHGHPESFV